MIRVDHVTYQLLIVLGSPKLGCDGEGDHSTSCKSTQVSPSVDIVSIKAVKDIHHQITHYILQTYHIEYIKIY